MSQIAEIPGEKSTMSKLVAYGSTAAAIVGALGVVDKALVEKASQSPVEADKSGHGLSTAESATAFNNEAALKKDAAAPVQAATPAAKATTPKP